MILQIKKKFIFTWIWLYVFKTLWPSSLVLCSFSDRFCREEAKILTCGLSEDSRIVTSCIHVLAELKAKPVGVLLSQKVRKMRSKSDMTSLRHSMMKPNWKALQAAKLSSGAKGEDSVSWIIALRSVLFNSTESPGLLRREQMEKSLSCDCQAPTWMSQTELMRWDQERTIAQR